MTVQNTVQTPQSPPVAGQGGPQVGTQAGSSAIERKTNVTPAPSPQRVKRTGLSFQEEQDLNLDVVEYMVKILEEDIEDIRRAIAPGEMRDPQGRMPEIYEMMRQRYLALKERRPSRADAWQRLQQPDSVVARLDVMSEFTQIIMDSQMSDPLRRHEEGGWLIRRADGTYYVRRFDLGGEHWMSPVKLSATDLPSGDTVMGLVHSHVAYEQTHAGFQGPSLQDRMSCVDLQLPSYVVDDRDGGMSVFKIEPSWGLWRKIDFEKDR